MISKSVLDQIRNGVCAVGYSTVPKEKYLEDTNRPYFKVHGTGFLVRHSTVLTNRHVIEKMYKLQREDGFPSNQIRLQFVYPAGADKWSVVLCRFVHLSIAQDLDIALVEIDPKNDLGPCHPLSLGDLSSLAVTEPVSVCGYPYGTSMLAPNGTVSRFGPVVNQGCISAISPYDVSSRVDGLLLDVRTAGGMSGSPVFRPTDGSVIGILYGGWEATTAVAIPIDDQRVQKWLDGHDQSRTQAAQSGADGKTKTAKESSDSPAPLAVMRAGAGEERASANNGG